MFAKLSSMGLLIALLISGAYMVFGFMFIERGWHLLITTSLIFLVLILAIPTFCIRRMWSKAPGKALPPECKTDQPWRKPTTLSFIEELKKNQLDFAHRYMIVFTQLQHNGDWLERIDLRIISRKEQNLELDYYEDYDLLCQRIDRIWNGDASLEIGDLKVKLQKGIGDQIDIKRHIEDLENWQKRFQNKPEEPPKPDPVKDAAEHARKVKKYEELLKIWAIEEKYNSREQRVKIKKQKVKDIEEARERGEWTTKEAKNMLDILDEEFD